MVEPCYREKEKASNLNKNGTMHGDIRRWCVGCYGNISNPIVRPLKRRKENAK